MIIWKHFTDVSIRFHFEGEGITFYLALLANEEGIDVETDRHVFHREDQKFFCDELFLEVLNMVPQKMAHSSLRRIWEKAEEIGIISACGFAVCPHDPMTRFFCKICGLLEIRERGEKVGIFDIRQALDD